MPTIKDGWPANWALLLTMYLGLRCCLRFVVGSKHAASSEFRRCGLWFGCSIHLQAILALLVPHDSPSLHTCVSDFHTGPSGSIDPLSFFLRLYRPIDVSSLSRIEFDRLASRHTTRRIVCPFQLGAYGNGRTRLTNARLNGSRKCRNINNQSISEPRRDPVRNLCISQTILSIPLSLSLAISGCRRRRLCRRGHSTRALKHSDSSRSLSLPCTVQALTASEHVTAGYAMESNTDLVSPVGGAKVHSRQLVSFIVVANRFGEFYPAFFLFIFFR